MPAEAKSAQSLQDHETRRDHAERQRDRYVRSAGELLERSSTAGRSLGSSATQLESLITAGEYWEARLAALDARSRTRSDTFHIVREPLTYDRLANPGNSWIADHYRAQRGDTASQARLTRHGREITIEMRARTGRATERRRGDALPTASFERRAPNLSETQGAEFTPPLWLVELTASSPRPQRTIADLVPSFPLPEGVASVNIPIITTGAVAQPATPTAAMPAVDLTDGVTSSRVMPIEGFCDVPLQLLEQSGTAGAALDVVVWRDLLAAYDAQLEEQLTAGPGGASVGAFAPGAQLLGVANVPGAGNVPYVSSTPTPIGVYPLLGQAFGTISNARKIRPECWLMRGGRWAFFVTGEDADGRPLGVPEAHNPAPTTPDDMPDPVGALVGIPVFTTEAISSTQGPGANQDTIIALRPSDCLLWEGAPRLAVFDEVLSGSLGARIAMWASAAFIPARLPSGICTITGTGMTVQSHE
jgi:hypothetical protein